MSNSEGFDLGLARRIAFPYSDVTFLKGSTHTEPLCSRKDHLPLCFSFYSKDRLLVNYLRIPQKQLQLAFVLISLLQLHLQCWEMMDIRTQQETAVHSCVTERGQTFPSPWSVFCFFLRSAAGMCSYRCLWFPLQTQLQRVGPKWWRGCCFPCTGDGEWVRVPHTLPRPVTPSRRGLRMPLSFLRAGKLASRFQIAKRPQSMLLWETGGSCYRTRLLCPPHSKPNPEVSSWKRVYSQRS